MICDKCKKNEATVHYKKIINGKKTEQHLCAQCAKGIDNTFGFDDIFNNVFNINNGIHYGNIGVRRCENCGITLDELNRRGKLGCSKCAESFRDVIEPALKNIHSGTIHRGKRPGKAAEGLPKVDKKEELQAKLKEAIAKEEYEKAAEIRDILKDMDKEA